MKIIAALVAALAVGALTTAATADRHQPKAHVLSARAPAPHANCSDARRAVPYYRQVTWSHQKAAFHELADFTPKAQGHSCPFARYAAKEWQGRARASGEMLARWQASIGQTVNRLNRGLAGSPMAGTGAILEKHGRQYHVSPYFMAAAAATESSLGRAACGHGGYNAWGLANCDGSWGVPTFYSWDDAIEFYARFLHERWPGAQTPYDFHGYAACSSCWGAKTSSWMRSLFGVTPRVIYP